MSVHELRTTETGMSSEYQATQLQKWFTYVFFAVIGLVGGAICVALTIGLMIMVTQTFSLVFDPNSYVLVGIAVLFSLGVSWLLERVLRYVLPIANVSDRHIQVVFVFSVLIVLLEGFVFMP